MHAVLDNIRKNKMVWYCHKISRYHSIVIVTNFSSILHITAISVSQYINIHIKINVQ